MSKMLQLCSLANYLTSNVVCTPAIDFFGQISSSEYHDLFCDRLHTNKIEQL